MPEESPHNRDAILRGIINKLCKVETTAKITDSGADINIVHDVWHVPVDLMHLMKDGQREVDELQVEVIYNVLCQNTEVTPETSQCVTRNRELTPEDVLKKGYTFVEDG